MTEKKKEEPGKTPVPGSTVPATVKQRLDEYVSKTLEHLQSLAESGNLDLPKDYSMENAIKGASLKLQMVEDKNHKPAIEVCTPTSIVNAMVGMVVDGLSVWKQQGYFIVYGNKLNWQPDYRGHILLAKRHADVKEVNAQVIYTDDKFVYQVDAATGRQKLMSHETSLDNQDIQKIKGAYAVVVFNDGTSSLTVMSLPQIKKAWLQGFGGGNTGAHQNFTDEMCKKTVINRATKVLIGSSDDSEVVDEEEQDKNKKARNEKTKGGEKKELNVIDTNFEEVKDDVKTGTGEPAQTAETVSAATQGASGTQEKKADPPVSDGPGY
jgi:recombination protein RecT